MCHLRLWRIVACAATFSLAPFASAQALPNLRILPIGDSITKGGLSSDGTGYRKPLRAALVEYGAGSDVAVDMIGTIHDGDMTDNDHEGHSGEYIEHIRNWWQKPMSALPNVVLLHVGTNNMDKNQLVDECPAMMRTMIDGMFEKNPDTVVLVAPIIHSKNAAMNDRSAVFNEALEEYVNKTKAAGGHIILVPMDIQDSDLSPAPDYKHPNNNGYRKMATKWKEAIIKANEQGWLKDASNNIDRDKLRDVGLAGTRLGNAGCDGGNWKNAGRVFDGFDVWSEQGVFIPAQKDGSRDKVLLADLNGDGIADYILADDNGTVRVWTSNGKPNSWTSQGAVNPDWSGLNEKITGDMIRMADVTGDGHADLILLYSDGAAKVWENVDYGKRFRSLDANWATGLESRKNIRFEDIDGDGLADYVILYSLGAVKWARNTGNNGKAGGKNWEPLQTIAPGPAGMPANRASLHDVDGDGLADYIIFSEGGAVQAMLNTGNLNSGGKNWDNLGIIAPGISGVTRDMIRFANADADGVPDFLAVADDGSIRWWKNKGIVGSKVWSIRFARLTSSGLADIVSIDARGRARAWRNMKNGKWEAIGEISPGFPDEDPSTSRFLFADLNGDGLDDYLIVDGRGAVKAFLNNGVLPDLNSGKRIWGGLLNIAPGVGAEGRKVQFADLNGDGWADYLVIYDHGSVDAWLNNKNLSPEGGHHIWANGYTVAPGVGEPGDNIRFADITGDGRDDFIIQWDAGAALGFANTGNIPDSGKTRSWYEMGVIAGGVNNQGPVRYAKYSNPKKDDYMVLHGDGSVDAYINICDWHLSNPNDDPPGGDDGGLNSDSACSDIKLNSDGSFPAKSWDDVDTQPFWKYYLSFDHAASGGLANSYAATWGISSLDCSIREDCPVPNVCSDYNSTKGTKGSAQGAVILNSIKNYHDYFQALSEAIDDVEDMFANLNNVFHKEYYPEAEDSNIALNLLLGIAGSVFSAGAALVGTTTAELSALVFTTIGDTISTTMESSDDELSRGADLQVAGFNFLNKSAAVIVDINDDVLLRGRYDTKDGHHIIADDLFEHGAWLDRSKIPILNNHDVDNPWDKTRLAFYFFNFLHAQVINWCWKSWGAQIVYIVGFKMSQKDFDDVDWGYDNSLKIYYDNRGYFFQSFKKAGAEAWEASAPPGWDFIDDVNPGETSFTVTDIIRSSVDAYKAGGLKYEGSSLFDQSLIDTRPSNLTQLSPRIGGTFSIPICILDDVDPDIVDLKPGPLNSGTMCHCKRTEDFKHNRFEDLFSKWSDFHCD